MDIARAIIEDIALGVTGLGSNTLTVGKRGRFPTIQAALDYVATQPAFSQVNLGTQGVVSAWLQNSSLIQCSTMPSNPVYSPDFYWLKAAGDTYYYPFEAQVGAIAGTVGIYSQMNRIEANAAANTALSWYIENLFTLMLTDPLYFESVNVNANMCVRVASAINSTWVGQLTFGASYLSGRFEVRGVSLSNGGAYGQAGFLSSNTANTVKWIDDRAQILSTWADFFSPGCLIGSYASRFTRIQQNPQSNMGHMQNFAARGDITVVDNIWEINQNSDVGSFQSPDAVFMDRFTCRNLMIRGLKATLRDPSATLGRVCVLGVQQPAPNNAPVMHSVYVEGVKLYSPDTLGTINLSIVEIDASTICPIYELNGNSIIAPRGVAVTKKLVRATANPGVAVQVNVGKSNESLATDAQANINYTAL